MVVTESIGDLFDEAPEGSILMHACNCQGFWGAGVALEFRDRFPDAYKIYVDYCDKAKGRDEKRHLTGSALLIPPQDVDALFSGRYWIACLMTSVDIGRRRDRPDAILIYTRKAIDELHDQIQSIKDKDGAHNTDFGGDIYTIRINRQRFVTPWTATRKILDDSPLSIHVVNNPQFLTDGERKEIEQESRMQAAIVKWTGTAPPDAVYKGSKRRADNHVISAGQQGEKTVALETEGRQVKRVMLQRRK